MKHVSNWTKLGHEFFLGIDLQCCVQFWIDWIRASIYWEFDEAYNLVRAALKRLMLQIFLSDCGKSKSEHKHSC